MQLYARVAVVKLMVDARENNTPRVDIRNDAESMNSLSRLNPLYAAKFFYRQMAPLLR